MDRSRLSVPIVLLEMGGHFIDWVHRLVPPTVSVWMQLVLANPVVLWAGWPFFVRGWASVRSRNLGAPFDLQREQRPQYHEQRANYAGAAPVSMLAIACVLDPAWGQTAEFLQQGKLTADFDYRICPWTGASCP